MINPFVPPNALKIECRVRSQISDAELIIRAAEGHGAVVICIEDKDSFEGIVVSREPLRIAMETLFTTSADLSPSAVHKSSISNPPTS